jgi:hypothetical protein
VPDDKANYIHGREKLKKKSVSAAALIHSRAQVQSP